MKKVLYVATVLSHICQFHLPYLNMFKEDGYEVHVAARDNLAEKNGLELKYTDKHFDLNFQRSPFKFKNIVVYKQLKKIINEEHYDVIVCNTPVGGILTRLAAKKSRKNGTKVIYIAHGFHFYKGAAKKNWMLYYPIEKHFAKKCDVVITINEEDYLFAKERFDCMVERIHGIGVSTNRYHPITNEEKIQLRQLMGYKSDDFCVLVVGELLTNKNQIQAIKAVEEVKKTHNNIKLLIAGNGSERNNLENYVKEHNLEDTVVFLGYCTNLEKYQSFIDVGVSCSIREGLGLNVIESMMSGNTFIATKNRGHNELIKDGYNGFLVDVHDFKTLANKLIFLMENQSVKVQMESNAMQLVQDYTIHTTLNEFKKIFAIINK